MRLFLICAALISLTIADASAASETLLLRRPDVSRTHIAFVHGGDLWIVPREGGGGPVEAMIISEEFGKGLR